MIQRQVRKTETGPNRVKYRVLVTGDECPPRTHEARIHHTLFLRWIADNQHLLECGFAIPERILITHNGTCWQAEADAEVDEDTSG